ncbi:methyl-accepting chemotaxis protein [Bacillaceae bacterium S4-13-58]
MKKKYKFSLRLKLVTLTTFLALITYTTSGFFIYFVYDYAKDFINISETWFTIITLFLGIIWSGILVYFAAQFIIRPLNRLEKAATQAAAGNIEETIVIPKSDDEIKALSVAFDQMLANLRQMVRDIDGNFHETNESVNNIKSAATQASTHADAISKAIQEIAAGAESTASSIQVTAESIEESTNLAGKVKEKAGHSRELSDDMVTTLNESKKIVQSLVVGIQSIANEQEFSLQSVKSLEQNAKEVEKIISLVGEIAEQTNLLALNASIEAARAGEHGKGFAVVANEVRKLADESGKAVQGISSLISSIQADVQQVVSKITNQVEFARKEAAKGTQTNQAIDEMTESIHEVVEAVEEISSIVEDQLEAMNKTSVQSHEVSSVAEETSAGTEEVNASIQEQNTLIENISEITYALEKQANALKKQIEKFTY